MLQAIEPGKELGNSQVKLWRNVFVDVDLREQGHQFRGFVNVNAVFPRACNDFFRNQTFASGDDAWGCIGLPVGEGNGLFE